MDLTAIEGVTHAVEIAVGLLIIWIGMFIFLLKEYHPWNCHMDTFDKWFVGVLCLIWPICLIVLILVGLYNLVTYKRKS